MTSRDFRSIRLTPDGVVVGGKEVADPGAALWIDCTPTPENLAWLGERFSFHPLALEDCAHAGQRTKFEEYPGVVFAVVHRLAKSPDDTGLLVHELHAFLTPEVLVTVHRAPLPEVDRVFDRCSSEREVLGRGPDFVLYLLWDAITDVHFAITDDLTDEIDELATEAIEGMIGAEELLSSILQARRSHGLLRRILAPQREVFGALARPGEGRVKERNAPYFRDVLDHLLRITDQIDNSRELLRSTMDIHLSMANNRATVVMARLTLAATIFMPLTFLTGFFGMNLTIIHPDVAKALVVGCIVVLPPAMLAWFKARRWL